MIDFEYCISGVTVSTPPHPLWNILQAGTNGAETWGKKEEVEEMYPSPKVNMKLYADNLSADTKDPLLVVCQTVIVY